MDITMKTGEVTREQIKSAISVIEYFDDFHRVPSKIALAICHVALEALDRPSEQAETEPDGLASEKEIEVYRAARREIEGGPNRVTDSICNTALAYHKVKAEQQESAIDDICVALREVNFEKFDEYKVALASAQEVIERLLNAADGLSQGTDWNNGTHAKLQGYREKLIAAREPARQWLKQNGDQKCGERAETMADAGPPREQSETEPDGLMSEAEIEEAKKAPCDIDFNIQIRSKTFYRLINTALAFWPMREQVKKTTSALIETDLELQSAQAALASAQEVIKTALPAVQ